MNKIFILTVLSMHCISLFGRQVRVAEGMFAALYSAYRHQISPATASKKVIVAADAVSNISITSSINTNVFKVAHKTVSGWISSGSSAVTGALFTGNNFIKTTSLSSSFTLVAMSRVRPLYTLVIVLISG